MTLNKSNHPVLTSEELGALLTPRQQQALLGVDLNFKWRHAFLLSFCLAYIVRLFFFLKLPSSISILLAKMWGEKCSIFKCEAGWFWRVPWFTSTVTQGIGISPRCHWLSLPWPCLPLFWTWSIFTPSAQKPRPN